MMVVLCTLRSDLWSGNVAKIKVIKKLGFQDDSEGKGACCQA